MKTSTKHLFQTKANKQQLEAIQATEGPLLIIAGPGSGKTFTLVERVVYLIIEKGAEPESLFVVTFTEKAAAELTTRVSNRLLELGIRFNLHEMYLGTFHSICLRLIEEHREYTRLQRSFSLMDQFDQQYFLYQNLDPYGDIDNAQVILGDPGSSRWKRSESLVTWLNKATEEALDPAGLIKANDGAVQALGKCLQLYHHQLEEHNVLDFSGIQYEALLLLRNFPEVLRDLRGKIKYMMVDEYQDTNTIQEMFLKLLCGENPNLCVVGDDDQGLYRFRGASIRNILTFKEQFGGGICKQVNLTINYRSHPDIIRYFNRWMEREGWTFGGQTFRYDKVIEENNSLNFPETATVLKVSSGINGNWHNEVYDFLTYLRGEGIITNWNQVAFLFRSVKHHRVVSLARSLEERGIGVYSPRSNMFFDREEVRLIFGALIFLFPQFPEIRKWSDSAHLAIWDYYDQECFAPFVHELRQPENKDLLVWARSLAKKHFVLTENTDYGFTGLFYSLLRFPLFSRFLSEDENGQLVDERAARNLAMLTRLLVKFEYLHHISVLNPAYLEGNVKTLFNTFLRFLKEGGIDEYEDSSEYAPRDCVSFLTIHQSKGLEFPVVMVGSLHATPRKQYTDLDEILERDYLSRPPFEPIEHTKYYDFWRLYYTAYSRAQNVLALTCQEVSGRGRTPSKHFVDYYDALPSWRDAAFIPHFLNLDQIKEVRLKREYSFTSHLSLFENCAQQYLFFKELEFSPVRKSPILFGTLVHQTIEDIHKTVLRGDEAKLSHEQISSWFETNYKYLTKRERVYLAEPIRKVALGHVIRYYDRHRGDWSRIVEAEVDISLVKDQYILKGSVDLITGEDDTVEIVDFKSEKKPDMEKDREKLRRYQRQLEVYAHLVEERTGLKVTKTHLYYTSEEAGNPYISFNKDDGSIERTIQTFDEVVGSIESHDFNIPERPEKLCVECDMRSYCDTKNWIFRVEK
ncbi:ATP-dependent helicase [Desulfofustis limnaeus]|uniref:ATP-dependent helicase n=1 Tax=Desulfofustis limnaeus TaxID=2740163 RepID=UPI00338D9FB2